MKRKELIQAKLDENQKVDFIEIHEDDKRSLDRMEREDEDKLHDVKKKIKRLLQNHTISMGEDFIALVEEKNTITKRITLINNVKKEYLENV